MLDNSRTGRKFVLKGCRYLEWFDEYDRTAVELPTNGCTLDGVRVISTDFLTWEPDRQYDLVLYLQVLEHIPEPTTFARKLFACGRVVIVSVPYCWPADSCSEHVHDPVDEGKLREWTGKTPMSATVVDARLVTAYCLGECVCDEKNVLTTFEH